MDPLRVATGLLTAAAALFAEVSFPTRDGGTVYADVYGKGDRGVVLVHGGRFNKESWAKQARVLADAGFRVLALDLRGKGKSTGPGQADMFAAPFHHDVLAAIEYLRAQRVRTISLVGGSLGGSVAADALVRSKPGSIDGLVLLAATPQAAPHQLTCRKFYIMAKDDRSGDGPRLPAFRKHFDAAPEPKKMVLLEGSAHAQFLFETDQGERVLKEIVNFLKAP